MKSTVFFLSIFCCLNLLGQNVCIPDANFKAYLLGNFDINMNGDTTISVNEAALYSGYVDCFGLGISDFTGIEAFTSVTGIFCSANQLTSLDVSQNTNLELLHCAYNEIETLDISNNPELTVVYAPGNQLTVLNTFHANALLHLDCSWNFLQSLDVSNNKNLKELDCQMNQLTCLNVANGYNSDFNYMWPDINFDLTCIEVDDVQWANANWSADAQASFSENCNNDCSSSTAEISEITTSKILIKILDPMGRETTFKPNTPLIYVYDDGSTEKVFSVGY